MLASPRRSAAARNVSAVRDPEFPPGLYRGTAQAYHRYRPPYPDALIADLAARTGADGTSRLLDLACGTGKVAFALAPQFAQVRGVDSEPEMIEVARRLAAGLPGQAAAASQATEFRFEVVAAEELTVPAGSVDLVTIGNAFHRLPRAAVAAAALGWLAPGGFLALLWGGSPQFGGTPWQRALADTLERWQHRRGAAQRVPAGYQQARDARPDTEVLRLAGFEIAGRFSFPVTKLWTADEVAGFVASSSILSAAALGDEAAEFDADLRSALAAAQPDGVFRQDDDFAYDLARRPAGWTHASSP